MAETEKKRGPYLILWLVTILIVSGISSLNYFFGWELVKLPTTTPMWVHYLYGVITLLNFIFIIFLFMWKKWAFFALCADLVLTSIINLTIGINIYAVIISLIGGIGITYLVFRPKWGLLEQFYEHYLRIILSNSTSTNTND